MAGSGASLPFFHQQANSQPTVGSLPIPVITSIKRISGLTTGGNAVVINGHHFKSYTSTSTSVNFGSNPCTVISNFEDFIVVLVPIQTGTGTANVTVTTPAGTSNSVAFNYFDTSSLYDPTKDPATAIAALPPGGVWDGGGGVYFTKGIFVNQPVTIQNATIIDPDFFIVIQANLQALGATAPYDLVGTDVPLATPIPNVFAYANYTSTNTPSGIMVGMDLSGAGIPGKGTTKVTGFDDLTIGGVPYCVVYLTPGASPTANADYFVNGTKPNIRVDTKNKNTIASFGPSSQYGRLDSTVSGKSGSNIIYDPNIVPSKVLTVTWSPTNMNTLNIVGTPNPNISITDLWQTIRGKYIPDGAYVGSVISGVSFTIVNSGGGPLATQDIKDTTQSFTVYIGGDQGGTVMDSLGRTDTAGGSTYVLENPILDSNILSTDVGSFVLGTGITAGWLIDIVVPGVCFTMKKPNPLPDGVVQYASTLTPPTSVVIGTRQDAVTTTINSSLVKDIYISTGDARSAVYNKNGTILGYVGSVANGISFTLINSPNSSTTVNITTVVNYLYIGTSGSHVDTVSTTGLNVIYDSNIRPEDVGKHVTGVGIPANSFVGSIMSSYKAFTLVNKFNNSTFVSNGISSVTISDHAISSGAFVGNINSSNCTFSIVDANGNNLNLNSNLVTGTNSIVVGAPNPKVNLYNLNLLGNNFITTYQPHMVGGHAISITGADSVYINNVITRFTNGDGLCTFFGLGSNPSNMHVSFLDTDCTGRDGISPCASDGVLGLNILNDVFVGSNNPRVSVDHESDLSNVGVGYIDWYRCTIMGMLIHQTPLFGPINYVDCDIRGEIWCFDGYATQTVNFTGGQWRIPVGGSGIYGGGGIYQRGGHVRFNGVKLYRNHNYFTISGVPDGSGQATFLNNYFRTATIGNVLHDHLQLGGGAGQFGLMADGLSPAILDEKISLSDVGKSIVSASSPIPLLPNAQQSLTSVFAATPNLTSETSGALVTGVVYWPSPTKPSTLPAYYLAQAGGFVNIGKTLGLDQGSQYYFPATNPNFNIASITASTYSSLLTLKTGQTGSWTVNQTVCIRGLGKHYHIGDGYYTITGGGTISFTIPIGTKNGVISATGLNGGVYFSNVITMSAPYAPSLTTITAMTVSGSAVTLTTSGGATWPSRGAHIAGLSAHGIPDGNYPINGALNQFTISLAGLASGTTAGLSGSATSFTVGDIVLGTSIPMGSYVGSITSSVGYNTSFTLVGPNGEPVFPNGGISSIWFGDFSNYFEQTFVNSGQIGSNVASRWNQLPYLRSNLKTDTNLVAGATVSGSNSSAIIIDTNIVALANHTDGVNGVSVYGDPNSNIILDSAVTAGYVGRMVVGTGIPDGSFVGSATPNHSFTLVNNFSPSAPVMPTDVVNSIQLTGDYGALVVDAATPSNIPPASFVGNVNTDATPYSFTLVDFKGHPVVPNNNVSSITIGGGVIEVQLDTGPHASGINSIQTSPSLHRG